ncbi:MAG TPA: pyridoxal-phosphate dependent enzyme [Anaerolineaceae bacterium]
MPDHFLVECIDCGHRYGFSVRQRTCPQCGSIWRQAIYDLAAIGPQLPALVAGRPFDLWRYRELLPVLNPNPDLCIGEGGTPLIRAANLGMMIGCPNIYLKDERQGPTTSFKDRQAAVTIQMLKEAGVHEMVVASTGNVAISYSAYAARAGIKIWAFLTSLVPAAKMREVAIYGTQVIKVTGTYDAVKELASKFAEQRGLFYDLGAKSIACTEGMKTLAYEIAEQLGIRLGPGSTPWRAPDWYVQAVSGGLGPLAVLKGFVELKEMGLIDRVPKIAVIQAEGCAPMVHGWNQDLEKAPVVRTPKTLIITLATGDPGRVYTLLRQRMLDHEGGAFETVSDEEGYRAMHYLAKMEGISVEPAAAVAVAGLVKLVRSGQVRSDEVVVINCTGHTMPVERDILGEGWSKDLVASPGKAMDENKQDGLLAALSKVSIDRYPRVAIVDDTPDARRLMRRILQSQGEFTIFEAGNGVEAIKVAQEEHPNLIILDLMMPEMDGFSVLDALQADPETKDIPVIVVTAKELTPYEKERLDGHIRSLMQKGDFMNDDLIDEIHALLG